MSCVRLFGLYYLFCCLLVCTAPKSQAHEPNDCLIQAYRLQSELPRGTWSRLLQVYYPGNVAGHIYLVWRLGPYRLMRQDAEHGARELHPRSLRPRDVARVADGFAVDGSYVDDEPAPLTARRQR